MIKKYVSIIVSTVLLLFLFCSFETVTASENTVDYSISANLPENQREGNSTYFDLLVTPGQEQELSVTIFNSSEEEQTFILEANTAITNNNGIIDYTQVDKKPDSSLTHNFSELVTHDKTITVGPNANKAAVFKLKVPEKPFDGMLLGGFHVRQEAPENVDGQINNTYSYALGVVLRENEQHITPDLKLNNVTPNLINYRPQVSVNLQNIQPINIKELSIKADIRKKGQEQVIKSAEKQSLSMAPNSNFDYAISWEDQALEAGEYELMLSAADQEGNAWEFKESFTITKKAAEEVNKSALGLSSSEEESNLLWNVLLGVAVVILIAFYLIRRQRALVLQQEMLEKQRRRKKKRKKKKKDRTEK